MYQGKGLVHGGTVTHTIPSSAGSSPPPKALNTTPWEEVQKERQAGWLEGISRWG